MQRIIVLIVQQGSNRFFFIKKTKIISQKCQETHKQTVILISWRIIYLWLLPVSSTVLFTSTGLYTKCYKRNREARRQPRKQRHCPRNESRKNPDTSQISKKFNTLNEKWIYKIRDTTWEMNLEKGRDTAWEVVCGNVVSQDLHCLHLYLVNNLGLPRGEPWNT